MWDFPHHAARDISREKHLQQPPSFPTYKYKTVNGCTPLTVRSSSRKQPGQLLPGVNLCRG
jgi:hypothetical protein